MAKRKLSPQRQRITHAMLMAEGKDQFDMAAQLATFVFPKPKVVEVSASEGHKVTMTIGA
jgi:hypothetical protein